MITSSVNRIIYNGNGTATAFSYPFKIIDVSDIKVMVVDEEGNKSVLVSDYYVDKNASKVYYPGYAPGADEASADTPPVLPYGAKIVIYREVPITQLAEMPAQWPFDVNEDMHDKSCIIDQQLQDGVDRSLKFDVDLAGSFNPTLPIKPGFGWCVNEEGTGIVPLENPSEVYENTVGVYEAAINDTQAIYNATVAVKEETDGLKADTLQIKSETQAIKEQTVSDANFILQETENVKSEADAAAGEAQDYSDLAKAWAQSALSPDGVDGSKSSKSWAEHAEDMALEAGRQADYCAAMAAQGSVYNSATTYNPGETCMTPEGNLWRCIAQSQGENPSTSGKWVLVAIVNSNTFEPDENGDLMPMLYPKQSSQFEIDDNGDVMPAL